MSISKDSNLNLKDQRRNIPGWIYDNENPNLRTQAVGKFSVITEIDPETGETTDRVYATLDGDKNHTDLYEKFLRANEVTQKRVSASTSIREIEQILA